MWKENTQKAWCEHAHAARFMAGWRSRLVDNWNYKLVDHEICWYSAAFVRLSLIEMPVMLCECFPVNATVLFSSRWKSKLRSGMPFCSVHWSEAMWNWQWISCPTLVTIILFNKYDFYDSHRIKLTTLSTVQGIFNVMQNVVSQQM